MGLPTLVTNWSGPVAFATPDTSFLIPVAETTDPRGYAQPSVSALANLMKGVVRDPKAAAAVGARARARMTDLFSPARVAGLITARIAHLAANGLQGQGGGEVAGSESRMEGLD